jgi:hypothetical protein
MTTPKCLCGAPVASWKESPIANKAGLCKTCAGRYLRVVESVTDLTRAVQKAVTS